MRFGSPPQLLYTLAVLALGLGAGWWLRGEMAPESPGPVMAGETPPLQMSEPEQRESAEWRPVAQGQPEPRTGRQSSRPQNETPAAERDLKAEFRAQLETQSFYAAMDIYQQAARRGDSQIAELKHLVMEYLERYLRSRDDTALTSLVDAFLSVYYDDIDVLLVLARYQLQSEYLAEAARTFQLAFSYSMAQVDRQQQVQQAFHSFVDEVDQTLETDGQWRTLIQFYETLQQLDLTRPTYQLRQAELYLNHGEPHYGYDLLERLTTNPAVSAQATAMLENADAAPDIQRETPPKRQPTDAIALEAIGSHFHLPLRLNNTLDIRLVIDTGASVTTLSRQKFDNMRHTIRFEEVGPQVFNTAGGTSKGTIYRVDSLQMGRHLLSNVHIAVLDFDMPEQVDGLLGMNVLQHFRFQVDQDSQQLHLQPRL